MSPMTEWRVEKVVNHCVRRAQALLCSLQMPIKCLSLDFSFSFSLSATMLCVFFFCSSEGTQNNKQKMKYFEEVT